MEKKARQGFRKNIRNFCRNNWHLHILERNKIHPQGLIENKPVNIKLETKTKTVWFLKKHRFFIPCQEGVILAIRLYADLKPVL